jgi:hypothetical protein
LFSDPASAKKKKILDEVLGRPYKQGKEYLYPSRCCGHHKPKLSINRMLQNAGHVTGEQKTYEE